MNGSYDLRIQHSALAVPRCGMVMMIKLKRVLAQYCFIVQLDNCSVFIRQKAECLKHLKKYIMEVAQPRC